MLNKMLHIPSEESSHTVQLEMSIWKCQNISKINHLKFQKFKCFSTLIRRLIFKTTENGTRSTVKLFSLIPLSCPITGTQIVFLGTQLANQQIIRQNLGKLRTPSLGDRRCVPPVLAYRGTQRCSYQGTEEIVSWNWFETAHFESAKQSKTSYSESPSLSFLDRQVSDFTSKWSQKLGSTLKSQNTPILYMYGRGDFGSDM